MSVVTAGFDVNEFMQQERSEFLNEAAVHEGKAKMRFN